MTFSRILPLDPTVANQIAAGEVIERPASIIKELVENALDAGATEITIDLEGAGVHLCRVRDNGKGIEKDDLSLAFVRHATSKIRTSDDLAAIHSLGFRGEALASIASVARCRIISATKEANTGWAFTPLAEDAALIPAAHATGTTVEVSDLFYNVPVRRKFLRSPKTELQAIDEMIKRLALSHSTVQFKVNHQGKLMRAFPSVSETRHESHRLAKICGPSFSEHAVHLSLEAGDLSITGWLGLPATGRRQADCQYFFINQRMVKDRFIHQIIKSLFLQHPEAIEGTYPCYVLYLTIAPDAVDVNVHPTKQEVRFHQPRWVHDFLHKAIADVLSHQPAVPAPIEAIRSPIDFTPSPAMPRQQASMQAAPVWQAPKMPHVKQPVLASDNMMPPLAQNMVAESYAFLAQPEGVVALYLPRLKKTLLTHYFMQNKGKLSLKSLLLPLRVSQENEPPLSEALIATLRDWGFVCVQQGATGVLLQQPRGLENCDSAWVSAFITLIQTQTSEQEIAAYLAEQATLSCLENLSVKDHQTLLQSVFKKALPDSYRMIPTAQLFPCEAALENA